MAGSPPIDPNLITLARLPLAPLAVVCLVTDTVWGVLAAAGLALLLEITDILDGKIARTYGAVSDFGKLFDPFSDAFSRFTLFLGLYAIGVADLWMIMAIFYRDSSVSFFRTVAATRQVVIAARPSGKIKAIVQGVGTQIIFIALTAEKLQFTQDGSVIAWWTMFLVTLVTLWSFLDYFTGSLPVLREAWSDRRDSS